MASSWSTISASVSVMNSPPVPVPATTAANLATVVCSGDVPVPAPSPLATPVVTMRSATALMSMSVLPESVNLLALRLTLAPLMIAPIVIAPAAT